MEFRGGTYISQVKEANVKAAMTLWAKSLDITQIQYLGEKGKLELQKELEEEEPNEINEVLNVWILVRS